MVDIKFRDKGFIQQHIKSILDFYQTNIVDKINGGFNQNFYDDGSLMESELKHLVSSTRMVFNYCKAYDLFADEKYLILVKQGMDFITHAHFEQNRNAYNWVLAGQKPIEQVNYTYGLAFVMLAYSSAIEVGFSEYKSHLEQTWQILELRLWQPADNLYADEANADWSEVSDYRGQNSNMHMCEACLAAFQATKEAKYLERAYQLAQTVAVNLADKADGLIWEHYTSDLAIDWHYNKNDPQNLYKPWGFQPGHLTEWAKLLITLYRHQPEGWMINRAEQLFKAAMKYGWDEQHGGLFYGFAPDKSICDDDKYFWVQCESFAAAAMLANITDKEEYWAWYDKIWTYSWQHFVDHKYGAWFRILRRDNSKYNDKKSEAGSKCDYHSIGACYSVMKLQF